MPAPTSLPSLSERLWHRRSVLKTSAAVAAALVAGSSARAATRAIAPSTDIRPTRRAKNVIFMVSDGMSMGTLSLADLQLRRTAGSPSHWVSLWNQPGTRRSTSTTHCADSLVTDSAAAASAWGSGVHINLGGINVSPEGGKQLMPILIRAKQASKAVGCVSTARITHATPAGFYANCPRRDWEGFIARQLIARQIDVALGGGARFFADSTLAGNPKLSVVRTLADLEHSETIPATGPILGIFAQDHMPYELDRPATVPTLTKMSTAALNRLATNPNGFVLQIEAGRVDHAAHANDAAALVSEQTEFDKAIGAVLRWMQGRDDTLLIITTDHGNANPGLTVYLQSGADGMDRLAQAKHSFEWIAQQVEPFKNDSSGLHAAWPKAIHDATGVQLEPEDLKLLFDSLADKRVAPFTGANKWVSVLGGLLQNHFGIGFISPNHSTDMVEVTSLGPGSELIPPYIDNIDLHGVMVAALGLPEATLLEDMHEPMSIQSRPKAD